MAFRMYQFTRLAVFIALLLACLDGFATDERYSAVPLKGQQVRKDSSTEVADSVYIDAGLRSQQTAYLVRNVVTFRINEHSNIRIPDVFSVTLNFKITYDYDDGGTIRTTTVDNLSLTIDYNKNGYYVNKAIYTFKGGIKAKVIIKSVTVGSGTLAQFESSLMVENEILVSREFTFDCSNQAVDTVTKDTSLIASKGELRVSWTPELKADEYDLEWTYIDTSALKNYYKVSNPSQLDPKKLFERNSTRVSITQSTYLIPLLYDSKGHLFFRVRSVKVSPNGQRIESFWSSNYAQGLGQYDFNGHERLLNWQATTSFAEEGKRKSVVQYYDGSLRARQTVTKDNTTDTTVVAETYYDFQGRPVIQVLPSPSLSSLIKYTPNFNAAINGSEYTKDVYDGTWSDSCYCTVGAPAMDSTRGASQYYSPQNPLKNYAFHKYIPDAKKYPFAETRYTPDNTGRIAMQGGVGSTFQIGALDAEVNNNSHETKYIYGAADQPELDALFGTEVGNSSHYFKNMVRDANGQYSVSYVDMHGRTIATALAGKPFTKMDTLLSSVNRVITKKLLDSGSNIVKGKTIESSKGLIVTRAGNHRFQYSLLPDSLRIKDCLDTTICYDCLYDLEINISDECNNTSFPNSEPLVIKRTNLSLSGFDIANNANQPFPGVDTSVYLKEGNYLITKKLTISQQAVDYYRDSIFLLKNTCKTLDQFIQEEKDRIRGLFTCDTLVEETNNAQYIRQQMLLDVTPPFGQYANPENIGFYSIFRKPFALFKRRYQTIDNYKDETGAIDLVTLADGNQVTPMSLSVNDFTTYFKESWADSLITLHPEYKRLLELERLQASSQWDERFRSVETYQAAKDSGFLNPGGWTGLPAEMLSVPAKADPLYALIASSYKSQMLDSLRRRKIGSGSGDTISVWSLATIYAHCKEASFSSCFNTYKPIDSAFKLGSDCQGELDMAWKMFREMYLQYKSQIVYKVVAAAGPLTLPIDPYLYTINIQNPVVTPTAGSVDPAAAQARLDSVVNTSAYEYASQWWEELKPCNFPNPGDSAKIISRFVQICKEGGDRDHPFGASSVKPSSNFTFRSFEQFLKFYCDSVGVSYNNSCNVYLISAPALYDHNKGRIVNNEVLSKPDSCVCTQIGKYYQQYKTYGQGDANFAAFVYRTTGVSMRSGALDTLRNACNGTINCTYFKTAIEVPTIFACGIQDVCANCGMVDSLYHRFKTEFPAVTPVLEDTSDTQRANNGLFEKFMNQKLGFSKSTVDYLTFIAACDSASTYSLDTLSKIVADFAALQVYQDTVRRLDASGCDTAHWKFNYSGQEKVPNPGGSDTYDFTVPLGTVISGGIASHPNSLWPTTGNVRGVSFDYLDRLCMGDGRFTYSARIKAPDTSLVTNFEYIGAIHAKFENFDGTASLRMEFHKTFVSVGVNNVYTNFSTPFTLSFNNWHDISLKFNNDSVYAYFDTTLLAVKYFGKATSRLRYFYTTLGSRQPQLDYYKLINLAGDTLFYEGFNGCNQTVINVPRFKSATCASDFTSYFNQRKGTSYTFNQVDSIYFLRTGSHVNVCADECGIRCDSLSSYYTYFKAHYDSLVSKYCDTVSGKVSNGGESLSCCQSKFKDFFNSKFKQVFPYSHIQAMYARCGIAIDVCQPPVAGPLLCGKTEPVLPVVTLKQHNPCDDSTNFATWKGTLLYEAYRDSLLSSFEDRYLAKCLKARYNEDFKVTSLTSEFHYTLYYYDQAGNLIKTVPPEGVNVSKFAWMDSWSDSVKSARAAGTLLVPAHNLPTNYRYNSLNQVVAQNSPDGGSSEFWYDRLGRLAISRNAKQKAASATEDGRFYSFTIYDYLGRITQVGQVRNDSASRPMTDAIARNQSDLATWLVNRTNLQEQITETVYDLPYAGFSAMGDYRLAVRQRNLRNRVSYVMLRPSGASGSFSSATFYSYDIHGNVDTLLQDFGLSTPTYNFNIMNTNGNRFKKIVYKYDLISGKVNMVQYQPGWGDMFLHRYSYDAENRLTKVETSNDSLIWETDARYQYYRHGPLARMVLGDQLVQGVDYAYTLQGWLKGVNSTGLNASYEMGGDGNSGSENRYVARDVYSYTLSYYTADYTAINSSVTNPFPGYGGLLNSNYRPLYNGNISSMVTNIGKLNDPLLYNYKYDQLNRYKEMDVYWGLNQTTNSWGSSLSTGGRFKERVTYDGNGNILKYLRNDAGGSARDSLTYLYYGSSNKLRRVRDQSGQWLYTGDLDNQTSDLNYAYDEIGNLIYDSSENMVPSAGGIKWNVYGKISEINRSAATTISDTKKITYQYDAMGNRIGKIVERFGTTTRNFTWYVRDAQGNVMAVYNASGSANPDSAGFAGLNLGLAEKHIYGSSRPGVDYWSEPVDVSPYDMNWLNSGTRTYRRGWKNYELSNHLGNVLVTITDKKYGVPISGDTLIDYYLADDIQVQDYYPFGMRMPNRGAGGVSYRYGFNGKETENDVKGIGNEQDYGMRIYDPRLGRFLSVDPLTKSYPWYTPYQFAGNKPIQAIDLDGEEEKHYTLIKNKDGTGTLTNDPSKTKEYNEIPLWLRIFTFGAGKSKYKILPRAVVTYGSNTYKIGFASSLTNQDKMGLFNEILKNPNNVDIEQFTSIFVNEVQDVNVAWVTWAVNMQNNTAMYGPLTSKAWYSYQYAKGSQNRLQSFLKFSPSWSKASTSQAIQKFAPGTNGILSADGVKTIYLNTKTNIEVIVDNENNYFRIYDHNKRQYLTMDGKVPSTGSLKGDAAKDAVQAQTHFVNTDKPKR